MNPIACSPLLPIADRRSEIRSRNEAWCGGDKKGLGRFIGRQREGEGAAASGAAAEGEAGAGVGAMKLLMGA